MKKGFYNIVAESHKHVQLPVRMDGIRRVFSRQSRSVGGTPVVPGRVGSFELVQPYTYSVLYGVQ